MKYNSQNQKTLYIHIQAKIIYRLVSDNKRQPNNYRWRLEGSKIIYAEWMQAMGDMGQSNNHFMSNPSTFINAENINFL